MTVATTASVAGDALGTIMISCEQSPVHVGLKPTWKGNFCVLLLIAVVLGTSILFFH